VVAGARCLHRLQLHLLLRLQAISIRRCSHQSTPKRAASKGQMQLKTTPRRSETAHRSSTLLCHQGARLARSSHGHKAVKNDSNEMAQSPDRPSHRSRAPLTCGKPGLNLGKARRSWGNTKTISRAYRRGSRATRPQPRRLSRSNPRVLFRFLPRFVKRARPQRVVGMGIGRMGVAVVMRVVMPVAVVVGMTVRMVMAVVM
jgi:hypothetical protein